MRRSTFLRVLLVAAVAFTAIADPAVADDGREDKTGRLLGDTWKKVLETPTPENVFAGGDPCIMIDDDILSPFGIGTEDVACTVETGTKIFVVTESSECSNVEPPPFFGSNRRELLRCAKEADAGFEVPTVVVDGRAVRLDEVVSGLINLRLGTDNIFGTDQREALSLAHRWVVLLHPLSRGTHSIVMSIKGVDVFGVPQVSSNTTTITVTGHNGEGH